MTRFPFYTNNESRDDFFAELGHDRFISRGQTLKHVAALKVGLWYDLDELMEDVGRLFYHELHLTDVMGDDWKHMVSGDVLKHSQTLRAEVQKALAPYLAQVDADITGKRGKRVRYVPPRGGKLDAFYLTVLHDALVDLRVKHTSNAYSLREMAEAIEDTP